MGTSGTTLVPWCVDGPTTLHGFDDDLVYMLVQTDTDDFELQREVALVSGGDIQGERHARMIAAVPRLLAACQAVVDRWERGDLAEAACMCNEAVNMALGLGDYSPDSRDKAIDDLLAKSEAAGMKAEDLDEIVHELAASIAADVNNSGMDGQLAYLIDQMGVQETTKQIERPVKERAKTTEDTGNEG